MIEDFESLRVKHRAPTVPSAGARLAIQIADFFSKAFAVLPLLIRNLGSVIAAKTHKLYEYFRLSAFQYQVRKQLRQQPSQTRRMESNCPVKWLSRFVLARNADVFMPEKVTEKINNWPFRLSDANHRSMVVRLLRFLPTLSASRNPDPSFTVNDSSDVATLSFCKFNQWLRRWNRLVKALVIIVPSYLSPHRQFTFGRASSPGMIRPNDLKRIFANIAKPSEIVGRFVNAHGRFLAFSIRPFKEV